MFQIKRFHRSWKPGFYGIAFAAVLFAGAPDAHAQRHMENLGRGVVAVSLGGSQVYVGWRMLGTDPSGITFNLYRNGTKITSSPISATNYTDTGGSTSATYYVRPVINSVEQAASATASTWSTRYLTVNLQRPAGGTTPDSVAYDYSPNDASVGDLDGDGEYEIVLKWDPSNSKDNSQSGYTGNVYLDAYELNGTRLWRIDLGINIRAGAHYTQFQVWDYDSDGRAEVMCKTAPGTRSGTGSYLSMGPAASDTDSSDYRNSSGYILSGPEYLTVFNGQTGAEMATTNYLPARGNVGDWGDTYGNRVDRFLACTAYLDGTRPSAVFCRGYYTRCVLVAWDWRGGSLSQRWTFDSNSSGNGAYAGQGNHNLSVGDVDGDGRDEITYGSCAINDNGTGLYTTGWGHGDALHMSDLDPDRAGQEVFQPHESANQAAGRPAVSFRDARTGALIWGKYVTEGDIGRGLAANMDSSHRGFESWGSSSLGVYDRYGNAFSSSFPSINFRIYWDADYQDEILDGEVIDKWNGNGTSRLLTAYDYGAENINGTKNNPCLTADILGDWREEAIWRNANNTQLLVFTTTTSTNNRLYTLMHDTQYREAVAWQNTAYNQPPHASFYIGDDMSTPPAPNIVLVGNTPTPGSPTATPTRTLSPTNTRTPTRTPTVTPTPPGYQELQLEVPCAMDGVLETTNAGWTGTGYANLTNSSGSTLVFSLLASGGRTVTLSFRYANGSTNSRDMSLAVNGTVQVASLAFPATGAWTTWNTSTAVVTLADGFNTLLLTSLTAEGGPNLDLVSWVSTSVTNGNCTVPTSTPTPTRSNTWTPTRTSTSTLTNTNTATLTPTRTPTRTNTATTTNTPSPTRTNTLSPTFSPSPSATPTRSSTATASSTPTNTRSFTPTTTNTPTPTVTNTSTATRTATPTPFIPTNTATPTATNTFTATATNTFSSTASNTSSFTATRTATSTVTRTLTPLPTHTSTLSPTASASPSATPTRSSTATASSTSTSTNTVTRTNTPMPTNTPTSTATHTATRTNTPLPTNTVTRTNTQSPTRSSTSIPTETRTLSGTATSTTTYTQSPTASVAGTATPTSTRTSTNTSSATATGTSTVTRTPSPSPTPSATTTLSMTATPSSTSSPTLTITVTRTPSRTTTPTITNTPIPSATIPWTPTVTDTYSVTPSSTLTDTDTPTSSPTPTRTNSPTSTMTLTPTWTPFPSATNTGTPTRTFTPVPTSTSSPTPTRTATRTPTATPSWTPTMTATSTPTETLEFTATITNTFIDTSTPTQTWTPTETATPSPSSTPSPTRTSTPSMTSSFTSTDTWTPVPSATPTWSPTETRSPTPSFTFTPTLTFTPTPTWTWTPTYSGTPTWTPTATPVPSDTPSPAHTITWTETAVSTATWTHTGTPSFTQTPTYTSTPADTGTSTPTWSPTYSASGSDCGTWSVSNPYPNPVFTTEWVTLDLVSGCPRTATWKVFTTSYRKVREEVLTTSGNTRVQWDLRDQKGKIVANGNYYLVFESEGPTILRKVMILR